MLNKKNGRRILLAPNVHTGGGMVLLESLLNVDDFPFDLVHLDERIRGKVATPSTAKIIYVKPTFFSRLNAECRLAKFLIQDDLIFCFNGLPPLFARARNIVVFMQNRILIDKINLSEYTYYDRTRLTLERIWALIFQFRSTRYIVQTQSMAILVGDWLKYDIPVSIYPFASPLGVTSEVADLDFSTADIDFIYIASGEPHKNHINLIEAWILLALDGIYPSLVLTLDREAFPQLVSLIEQKSLEHKLKISNHGNLSLDDILKLYLATKAMIFPSGMESFGLPLVEATRLGLPILAPEMDYVRDVSSPIETFNPSSPRSIARSVKRFLKIPEFLRPLSSPQEFLIEVFK